MAGNSGHRDAIALLGAFVLLVVPVWIVREIRSSDNPVDSATLYGAYLAAAALTVSLLVVLVQWWWKGCRASAAPTTATQVMAAADQLAGRMLG
ncbi:MAG: hypothetical protein ACREX8_03955, partial [Gammaproteobacteria bacterium]